MKICNLTLELNWYDRLGDGNKIKIQALTQNTTKQGTPKERSFHVVERTRTAAKCTKMKKTHEQRVQNHCYYFVVSCRRCRRGCLSSLFTEGTRAE